MKNFIGARRKFKINLEKMSNSNRHLSEIKRIEKNVDKLRIISLRKQNTFDKNSKQVEEKIKDELKKEILSTIFTEYRIKKNLKKLIIQVYTGISQRIVKNVS